MKHLLKPIVSILLTATQISPLSQLAYANDWPVTDPAFSTCIEKLAAKKQWTSAAQIKEIQCHNKKIRTIEGIEHFTHLEKLSLYKNRLKSVQLPDLPHLSQLNLAGNQIETLTLHNLERLNELYLFKNRLKNVTIHNLPALQKIKANNNQITEFKITQVTQLTKLYLFDNELASLDMEKLPNLTYLDARQNPMPDEFYDQLDDIASLTALHDGNADDWQ